MTCWSTYSWAFLKSMHSRAALQLSDVRTQFTLDKPSSFGPFRFET